MIRNLFIALLFLLCIACNKGAELDEEPAADGDATELPGGVTPTTPADVTPTGD